MPNRISYYPPIFKNLNQKSFLYYTPSLFKSKIPPFDQLPSGLSLRVEDRVVTVRLRSPFNFVQGDPEFIEGSLSLSKVEGSEVEPLKAGRRGRGMSSM
jgi:hypothetical protein